MRKVRLLIVGVLAAAGISAAGPAWAQELPDLPGMGTAQRAITPDQQPAPAPAPAARGQVTGTVPTGMNAVPAEAMTVRSPDTDLFGAATGTSAATDTLQPLTATEAEAQPVARGTAAAPAASRGQLPRTGGLLTGLALLGVALMSGGRLLVELARR